MSHQENNENLEDLLKH